MWKYAPLDYAADMLRSKSKSCLDKLFSHFAISLSLFRTPLLLAYFSHDLQEIQLTDETVIQQYAREMAQARYIVFGNGRVLRYTTVDAVQ